MMKTKIVLDRNADYGIGNLDELCQLLIAEIVGSRLEMEHYDINDSFIDYLEGSIAAREVVLGRLGVPSELYSNGDC
jgi:hypothetical protein